MKKYILKHKMSFFTTTVLITLYAAFNVAVAWMLQYVVDAAMGSSLELFFRSVMWFGAYIILAFLVEIFLKVSKATYIKKTVAFMRKDLMNGVLNQDIATFTKNNSAKYISVLNNDISVIEQDYILSIFNIINNIVTFTLAFISLLYINVYITLVIIVISLFAFTIPQLFSKNLSNKKLKYSMSLEKFTIKIKDLLLGFEVIKNFNIENRAENEFIGVNNELELTKKKFSIYSGFVDSFAELLGTVMFMAPILIGGYLVITGKVTVGILIALIQLMNNLSGPLIASIQHINKLKSSKEIVKKVNDLVYHNNIEESQILEKVKIFSNSIKFNDVVFSYDENKLALNKLNIEFEKGKKYAIVGESGSGKSTIIRLLQKYYNNFQGNITLDNVNLKNIGTENLYNLTSIIHQNVFMFSGTIKDNITLYNDYSDEEVMEVVKTAGLYKLVSSLPKGIYEDVGENGNRLSGGEKQRVSISRALIKNSSILLLDESTSALDNKTSFEIEKAILSIKDLTAIVITHKLTPEVLESYDKIYVLKNGRLIEEGNFNTLVNNKGYFYSMYTLSDSFDDDKSKSESEYLDSAI
ncbi:ABC transporter ATP-binding protein [Clostridium sp.]|uniref:ABC transporter ATP-binding protein n=1 Tax=Clostridium sp. TaxID=1506 RepID=UPI0032166009